MARDRAAPGLGRAWAGPPAAGRLVFCIHLGYSSDIFGFQGCVSLERLPPMKSYCI